MALTRSFPVDSGFPVGLDLRRELAGIVPREGVFPDPTTTAAAGIAYANGGWNVGALPFVAAVRRGFAPFTQNYGTALVANDASGTAWTIPSAPATGSRIDLLWVRATDPSQGEATSGNDGPGGVARAVPVFGVTAGTAGTTPVAPALPSGALLIATVTTAAGAASITTSTFAQSYRFAHVQGGPMWARNVAETTAAGITAGEMAYLLDKKWLGQYIGGALQPLGGILPYAEAAVPASTVAAGTWVTPTVTAPGAGAINDITFSAPGRFTIVTKGRYRFTGHAVIPATSPGQARVLVNGSAVLGEATSANISGVAYPTTSVDFTAAAGSTVEFQIVSNTGGNLFGGRVTLTYIGAAP